MPQAKLLSSRALKLKVGAGAIALLAAGSWLAPTRTTPLTPSQERAAPLLEQQVQQRLPAPPFRGVQDIAGQIDVRGVALSVRDEPAPSSGNDFEPYLPPAVDAFGVPLGSGFVLTHRLALGGARQARVVAASGAPVSAQLAAYDEATGLVLLRTDPSLAPAVAVATTMPASGSLAVAAASWPEHDLILPVFVALVSAEYVRVGGDGGLAAAGLPIYDAEGRLFAISLGRGEARPVRAAIDRLLQRAMSDARGRSFGLAFQAMTPPLASIFGDTGVIVADTLPGGPAAQAGVRPGDVVTAVQGSAVTSPDQLGAALTAVPPASAAALTIRRDNQPMALEVLPIDAYDAAALAGRARTADGVAADALLSPAQLASSGIPAEARLISVNGLEPRTAAARRAIAQGAAAVLVRHGARQYFVLLDDGL